MSSDNPPESQGPSRSSDDRRAVLDLLKETIGYEQGLWRTLLDLRTKPQEVLEGYLQADRKYASPFKLLTTCLSLWLLINGFLIDWYAIWSQLFTSILDVEVSLITWISDLDATKRAALDQRLEELAGPMLGMVSQVAGDLFSKWYIPFAILAIVGASWLFTRWNPGYGLPMKDVLAGLSYSVGSNIPLYLGVSIGFGIHMLLGLSITLFMALLLFFGKAGKLMYAAPGKFFPQHEGIEKKLVKATFTVTIFLQILLIIGYVIYFKTR